MFDWHVSSKRMNTHEIIRLNSDNKEKVLKKVGEAESDGTLRTRPEIEG